MQSWRSVLRSVRLLARRVSPVHEETAERLPRFMIRAASPVHFRLPGKQALQFQSDPLAPIRLEPVIHRFRLTHAYGDLFLPRELRHIQLGENGDHTLGCVEFVGKRLPGILHG